MEQLLARAARDNRRRGAVAFLFRHAFSRVKGKFTALNRWKARRMRPIRPWR
jgi:hypothetical protein